MRPCATQVRVQRSFSFEELQSGSYFSSLDEFDLQFYRVYGQPVVIPSPDEVDGNFIAHSTNLTADFSCENDGILTSKSYTLLNPLGEGPTASQSIYSAAQPGTPNHDWYFVKQEPVEVRHIILTIPHYLISSRA